MVTEIMPFIKLQFRIKNGPKNTMVMGSSLGGVVSFYLGWEYLHVFGTVDFMSSTFSLFGRDFEIERNLHHVVFPRAQHSEHSWSARCHLPLQLFSGKLQRLTRPAE